MDKRYMRFLLLAIAVTTTLQAQTTINGGRLIRGQWDASGAQATKPSKAGTQLPASCSAGEQFFKIDAAAGQNLYFCTAPDVWAQMKGGTNCNKYTIDHTQLKAASTSHNIVLFTMPAKGKMVGLTIKESIPFACWGACSGITSLAVSIGRTGTEADYSPQWPLMQTVTDINVYDDGGHFSPTTAAHDVVARFSVTNTSAGNLGDGNTTRLTGGAVEIWACTLTLP